MEDKVLLKRKIYNKLLDLKNQSNGKSAMLVEGARRVGKSTIVEEFAKNEYKSYILIDFNKVDEKTKNLFIEERENINYIFEQLSFKYSKELYNRESVIIFDEVQFCPEARSFIKYLVDDGRYDYIETGSLISIKKNVEKIVIPSEEESITMYPLDFEEFCWALEDTITVPFLKECFEKRRPLVQLHHEAMKKFRTYLMVGGMPQAVVEYKKTLSLRDTDVVKRRILKLYKDDIGKYASNIEKTLGIYLNIPGELSKKNKTFTISSIEENARNRSFEDSIIWLNEAKMVNTCYNVTDPSISLLLTKDKNDYKCYHADTGLLITQTFENKPYLNNEIYKALLDDKLNINEGMIVENYVAQTLKNNGYDLFFYRNEDRTNQENTMEIAFIISQDMKLNPIEVKSGNYKKHTSIDRFKKKYNKKVGTRYVLHTKDLKVEGDLVYLPLYMTMFL